MDIFKSTNGTKLIKFGRVVVGTFGGNHVSDLLFHSTLEKKLLESRVGRVQKVMVSKLERPSKIPSA